MTSTHLANFEDMPINQQLRDEYERQILTMLIGGDNVEKKEHIISHLHPDMFTSSFYKKVYKSLLDLHTQNKKIEVGNICEILKTEDLKKLTIELDKEYITNQNCDYYLEKIINDYLKRLLKECDSFEEYKKLEKLKQKYAIKKSISHISDATDELIVEYYNHWGSSTKSYYPQLDEVIGSFLGGDFIILAGATSMGKTCFALNLILNMTEKDKKVLLFSLEMNLKQLQNRIIANKIGIDSEKFRKFNLTNHEQKIYSEYAMGEEFKKIPLDVCTLYDITVPQIREIIQQSDADIIFIDYLGLIKSTENGNSYEKVSAVSRELKLLANEVNKPIVALHQLNRIPPERKDKKPKLSDLRDSGKIEQDADTIIFVYRESYYTGIIKDAKKGEDTMEIIISKSRHTSGCKELKMQYFPKHQLIIDKIGELMKAQEQQRLGL